jgi:hypothetical protein
MLPQMVSSNQEGHANRSDDAGHACCDETSRRPAPYQLKVLL